MWRSKTRALLLLRSLSSLSPQVPLKTLTLTPIPNPSRSPHRLFPSPRFFSANPRNDPASDDSWTFEETPSAWDFDDGGDGDGADKAHDFGEITGGTGDSIDKGDTFGEPTKEIADGVDKAGASGEIITEQIKVAEISTDQIESVVSILKGGSEEAIEASLDKLELNLGEEFVMEVIESSVGVCENLIGFYRWALRNNEGSVKSSRVLERLVLNVGSYPEVRKMEAYMLWDLVKEFGKTDRWVLNVEILNSLIHMFWKLGKAKAGLEVFNVFDEFGFVRDADSFYYTIKALGCRSLVDTAWSVCEKMLNAGILPDGAKMGEIISFFCGLKVKEAHSLYLAAREKNMSLNVASLDTLIQALARKDETVSVALEVLEDYPKGSVKHSNRTFGQVIKGLCRVNNVEEARKLLLRMAESGPAPGNASFNYVINGLSKGGELDQAVALMKVMEGRGLRPDVYTYTVVMSGYAKGGLMDEAYKIFCEAKKRHAKLSPATYHVLTRGYCKMEEFDKALDCLKEMKEQGMQPNADEYNKMIQSLCLKAVDWCRAEKLMEEMKESGLHVQWGTRSLVAAVRDIEKEETQAEAECVEA